MKLDLKLPDIILTAAYSAIYFLIIGISAMFTVFVIPGYSFIFIPILIALLAGSIYYLQALKVPKFGAITFMASIIGIFYLISGRYPASIIFSILFGFLADSVAKIGNYRNQKTLFLSYILFSFSNIGPILPIFTFQDSYANHIEGTGQNLDYVQRVFQTITTNSAVLVTVALLVSAIIGGLIGRMLIKKHFMKVESYE